MRRQTFNYLCDKLRPSICGQNTWFRSAIDVERRVAIILWCLATPCEYRTVAHLFGVARCTVCKIVQDTCHAIVQNLMEVYIKFPTGEELKRAVARFEEKWGFPQWVGKRAVARFEEK